MYRLLILAVAGPKLTISALAHACANTNHWSRSACNLSPLTGAFWHCFCAKSCNKSLCFAASAYAGMTISLATWVKYVFPTSALISTVTIFSAFLSALPLTVAFSPVFGAALPCATWLSTSAALLSSAGLTQLMSIPALNADSAIAKAWFIFISFSVILLIII